VEATIDGVRMRIGGAQFVAALGGHPLPPELALVADDVAVVALGDTQGWIALFTFVDPVRAHAHLVVRELMRLGRQVHLLSGDRPQIVAHVAHELGIPVARGGVTPDEKLAYVQQLQQSGAIVAMIGDGVNDAAGLAAAHVSIAMGGGADVACSNSDVILLSNRIESLPPAVRKARSTLRVIRQNLAWASVYNLMAIPLAACGYVSPLVAGIGMAASSMLVVANALRLLRPARPPVFSPAPSPVHAS
jgi:Cu2+-exporting ATPase